MSNPTQPPPPSAADFATRDPANASFWDERFARGVTPWEFGGVPDGFRAFAQRRAPCTVLIPAAAAQEAGWLAQAGWPVRAIDFAEQAVAAAKATLGAHADVVEQADFSRTSRRSSCSGCTSARSCARCRRACAPATRRGWPNCCRPADCWPAISS
jgi:hypothetical protein